MFSPLASRLWPLGSRQLSVRQSVLSRDDASHSKQGSWLAGFNVMTSAVDVAGMLFFDQLSPKTILPVLTEVPMCPLDEFQAPHFEEREVPKLRSRGAVV